MSEKVNGSFYTATIEKSRVVALDGTPLTFKVDIYCDKKSMLEMLNELSTENRQLKMAEWIDQLTELSKQYNFKLTDVPDILEEYILIDNEVIEQKNIENTIKEALNNERTHIGQSVLKQLLEAIQ